MHAKYEQTHPDDLQAILEDSPVAYVPLGTYEHHGFHLPVGFDGIKAYELCLRAAERTGGVVMPTLWYGIGGGHVGYKWTLIVEEEHLRPLLATTAERLVAWGAKVVVLYTGHYAGEQVALVRQIAEERAAQHPGARFWGVTDPDITTPLPGDTQRGDHAAKYETSIAMYLRPEWVKLDYLSNKRDPDTVTLPETPRLEGRQYDPSDPLYAVWGDDPATTASAEAGSVIVEEILERLTEGVRERLADLDREA